MELLKKIAERRGLDPEELIRRVNEWKPKKTRDIDAELAKLKWL